MESLSSTTAILAPPPPNAPINDENMPPSTLSTPAPPGQHLSGKVLRPTRTRTRTCFRDLTNTLPETPRVRGKGTPRKRKARSNAVLKNKKLRLHEEEEPQAPILQRSDLVEEVETEDKGQSMDNVGPPKLEKMVDLEVTSSVEIETSGNVNAKVMEESVEKQEEESTPDKSSEAVAQPLDETPLIKPEVTSGPPESGSPKSGLNSPIRPSSTPTPQMAQDLLSSLNNSAKSKRKKPKGRNGNIYIGVANRIIWLKLQEQFGFDNINNFGNFVMGYMNKVFEDFGILHQVAVDVGLFSEQGLTGFTWVNGLPHPVNEEGQFIQLPEVQMSEEYEKRAFQVTYDLCVKRGKFLIELASGSLENNGAEVEVEDEDGVTEGDVVEETGSGSSGSNDPEQKEESTSAETATPTQEDTTSTEKEETKPQPQPLPEQDATVPETPTPDPVPCPESESIVQEASLSSHTPQPHPQQEREEITFQLEFQPEGATPPESLSIPISLDLNLDLEMDSPVDNKENIAPSMTTPTSNKEAESIIKEMDEKKAALRQILGDISLESICSPENFTPISTPTPTTK